MNFLKQFHFFKRIGGINIFSRKLRRNKTIVCIFKKKKRKIEFKHLLVTLLDSELNVL